MTLLCFLFLQTKTLKAEKFLNPIYENVEGYFGSINNQDLFMDFSCKFSNLFEEVGNINVFLTINGEYFYQVHGYKNEIGVIQNFKINPDDVPNEVYTYINFESFDQELDMVEYCYEPVFPAGPSCDPNLGCTYVPYSIDCFVFICGVKTYFGGQPYCIVT
jgi:hypothetical protein